MKIPSVCPICQDKLWKPALLPEASHRCIDEDDHRFFSSPTRCIYLFLGEIKFAVYDDKTEISLPLNKGDFLSQMILAKTLPKSMSYKDIMKYVSFL